MDGERSTGGLMSILLRFVGMWEAHNIIQVTTTIVVIGDAFLVLAPSVAWIAIVFMPLILLASMATSINAQRLSSIPNTDCI